MSGISPADWYPTYRSGGSDPHEHTAGYAILPSTAGGDAHRVLLRNPYADIGLTCLDGQAAVWIGERIDRDYRIRCEWSDVLARQHRADFRGLCRAPRLCPHRHVDQPWLEAA
jgi:hypothetical protein